MLGSWKPTHVSRFTLLSIDCLKQTLTFNKGRRGPVAAHLLWCAQLCCNCKVMTARVFRWWRLWPHVTERQDKAVQKSWQEFTCPAGVCLFVLNNHESPFGFIYTFAYVEIHCCCRFIRSWRVKKYVPVSPHLLPKEHHCVDNLLSVLIF